MLTYMMEDTRTISMCTHLLFSAKNLERVGDHATNIAEQVMYIVRGEHVIDRIKKDQSSFAVVQ
jgi:phosphate transport system protein